MSGGFGDDLIEGGVGSDWVIPKSFCRFEDFLTDTDATRAARGIPGNRRYRQCLIEDSIEELPHWYSVSDAYSETQKAQKADPDPRVFPMADFVRTPAPVAGRNDPCPCGSGKTFKTCCLQ